MPLHTESSSGRLMLPRITTNMADAEENFDSKFERKFWKFLCDNKVVCCLCNYDRCFTNNGILQHFKHEHSHVDTENVVKACRDSTQLKAIEETEALLEALSLDIQSTVSTFFVYIQCWCLTCMFMIYWVPENYRRMTWYDHFSHLSDDQHVCSNTWIPWNLSFRYIHCAGPFTPKMKANAEPRLLSSLMWIDSGVVVSQHRWSLFSWNKM